MFIVQEWGVAQLRAQVHALEHFNDVHTYMYRHANNLVELSNAMQW